MNRFKRPVFVIGFTILSVAAAGLGLVFVEAAEKGDRRLEKQGRLRLATALLTEDFSYTAGTTAASNGWTPTGTPPSTVNPILVTAPGLTFSSYAGSGVGNAVTLTTTGEDVSKDFTAVTSGTVYAAFMVNVASSQVNGDYFFHLMNFGTTAFRGRVFAKKDAATSNFFFGLSRTNGTPIYTAAASYSPGTTYLLVVKYTYVDGASNDVVQLFVDPTPGGAEPASATLTATDADTSEPIQLSGVGIRQGNASNAPAQQIDGIRVATTWAEAVAAGGGPTPTPTPQKPNVDMNGDGLTDFVITREAVPSSASVAGSPAPSNRFADRTSRSVKRMERLSPSLRSESLVGGGPQYEWWIDYNNSPGQAAGVWGLSQVDNTVSADFDGDDTDDVAVWRPGGPGEAGFYSINSSDGTFRYSEFGLTGDDATVVGDYDGDGFDDPATFRCPDTDAGQCYFFYRGSLNNPTNGITYIAWGFGTIADYYPNPGDFDGDGKYDFCLQDLKTLGQATFWLWLNGTETFEATQWGTDEDFVVPGDFNGDGKSDYCVMRIEADDTLVFYIRERDGDMRAVQWGIFGDIPVPGDYDGDGSQDIAVYRWNTSDATFWILPSNGDPYSTFDWGIPFDEPLAAWYVH